MRKGSDTIGQPVIAFDTGEKIEKVHDLIFDQSENRLLGFVVDDGGWFSDARVLPLETVRAIGADGVIVSSKDSIIKAHRNEAMKRILERNNVLKGTKIMTTDGRDLGTMVDLYYDEQTGAVEGYEVSGGLFADAYSGRSFVPAPHTLKIGEDVAFVSPDVAGMMEEQVGGIQGAMQVAGEKVQDAAQVAGEKMQDASQRASDTLQQAVDTTQSKLQQAQETATARTRNAVVARTVEQTRGRRVREVVHADDGRIIAAGGQIVTDSVIERAREHHKEQALMDAVGLNPQDAARTSARATLSDTSAQLSTSAQQAKEGVKDIVGRVKDKMSELQERSTQQLEEQRIKNALGRPVTRVILDRDDTVILNTGELITNQAIERARQAGVLDILVSSVHDKAPQITQEQLRAPEPGQASLEQRDETT